MLQSLSQSAVRLHSRNTLGIIGDVRVTWSFSAFTVLIYYAITNLAALYIPAEKRLFPVWVAVASGLHVARVFVVPLYWGVGLG